MWRARSLLAVTVACTTPPAEGLSAEAAMETIEAHRAALESCHEGEQELRLQVRLVVAPDGTVRDVRARGSARLGPCVESAMRSWSFPARPSETEIDVPVVFAARH